MHLLLTRPEPDAQRSAQALRALGHQVIVAPLLRLKPVTDLRLPKRRYQAVLVTSANAVRVLRDHREMELLLSTPVLAVGDSTALLARRAGFGEVRSAGGSLEDLVKLAENCLGPAAGPLLYLVGRQRSGDLGKRLEKFGFKVDLVILYDMEPTDGLGVEAMEALRQGSIDGALFYSRRSAAAFALAARAAALAPVVGVHAFCLSQAAGEPLVSVWDGPVHVAEKPDQIHLFAEIEAVEKA